MPSWRKHLRRMLESPRCVGFTYGDCAAILRALDFTEAQPGSGSSHRKWRRLLASGTSVYIGLLNSGHGEIKAVYIKDMLEILRAHDLIPSELTDD